MIAMYKTYLYILLTILSKGIFETFCYEYHTI